MTPFTADRHGVHTTGPEGPMTMNAHQCDIRVSIYLADAKALEREAEALRKRADELFAARCAHVDAWQDRRAA